MPPAASKSVRIHPRHGNSEASGTIESRHATRMSLAEYRRKRQFGKTREPEPGKPLPRGKRAMFVVQLHHATRRHYDFRLQVGDALKSWAVPKGPSYDPKVKRMAVEVEDHPVDYAQFEGDIPKGEYGGGHVAQFDHGVWSTEGDAEQQLAKGHLRFELFGEKLKGGWHLVRSGKPARQPQWLLFKDADAYAGTLEADDLLADVTAPPASDAERAGSGKATKRGQGKVEVASRKRRIDWSAAAGRLSRSKSVRVRADAFELQLARAGTRPPEADDWLHELKWDGYRIAVTIVEGKARLWSRNAIEWTAKLPEIAAALEALHLGSAMLDGELIAGRGAKQDFGLLQATLSGEKHAALNLMLFDVLAIEGIDVSKAPLRERKELLARLLASPPPHLALSTHVEGDGNEAFAAASRQGFEGIISKRADRPYSPGRSDDWRKSKSLDSDEYAVVGFTKPRGSRQGFGSLLLARPDPVHGWTYAGRVGSGFDAEQMRAIGKLVGRATRSDPGVHVGIEDPELRKATWFAPRFVVEVFDRGRGNQGLLRQPSLKAIRLDKNVEDLVDNDRAPRKKKSTEPRSRRRGDPASRTAFRLTSPDKLVFPDDGITKAQVAAYYEEIAPRLLREIGGRPVSVVRCPEGTAKACFFQKHHTAGLDLVGSVRLKEESGVQAHYLVVDSIEALMELVQFNAIEFHPWGARADAPDRADRIVFDLDPAPDVAWSEVKRAARQVRDLLAEVKLKSYLRTSGGKGLHVVVPLNPGCDWKLVKRFAHGFAAALAAAEPARYVATATLAKRKGKIFVDYLRNGRGATSIASYSLRARPGAPVAMPLAWTELSRLRSSAAFDLETALRRLRRQKQHPWHGFERVRQDLSAWSAD